jgi:hypothetical protein
VVAADAGDVTARSAAATTLAEAVSWEAIGSSDFPDAIITESGERRLWLFGVARFRE